MTSAVAFLRTSGVPAPCVMILVDSWPHFVCDDHLLAWNEDGYGARLERYLGTVKVLTPRSTVAVLRSGYRSEVHCSAG